MYVKKKLIFTSRDNKPLTALSLSISGNEINICIKNKSADFDGFFVYDGENSVYFSEIPLSKNLKKGSCVTEFALLKGGEIVSTKNENGETACPKIKKAVADYFAKKERVVENSENETAVLQPEIEKTVETGNKETEEIETTSVTQTENSAQENTEERVEEIFIEKQERREIAEFYCSIKQNLDEMFVIYPKDEVLESLIPDSTWVKITRQDGHYVVGLIRENATPRYVCYGVPSEVGAIPPDNLKKYCQWLPTTPDEQNGYWIVFQDANTGETLCGE